MDDFEKRRIEFYLEETDQITEVWGGESSGDENVVENDNRSDHDTDSEQSVYDLEYDHERDCRAIKGRHRSTLDLWKTDGLRAELLPCVMSEKRFQFLLRCIRFDDIRGRDERIKVDKITHIRWVFEHFVDNCKNAYSVSEYITIDEKLQAFRGVQPDGPFKLDNSASSVVNRLVQPFRNTGRNITTDNWFTSVPLAIDLFNNYKLTLVGTIRKNKRQLPIEFTSTKNRPIYTSYFGFSEDKVTIVSYTPKKNKIALLLSTMHHSSTIDESTKEIKKPEIITFYNCTKGAVDTMDKKTENYTVAPKSCRWPLTVFYSILNIAGVNSQIIFQENTKIKMSRLNFLKTLSRQLMEEQLKYRLTIDLLPKTIKFRLKQYSTKTNEATGTSQRVRASGRCAFCERA
ncbi:piggyBac transposable element-derived protein 4-like [Aphis gossypii]|uniref:piggyBac transposable element-derived protein 4-like n=1 Tax=Aphis gossypii TaxID=80765 RepID=UPI0021595D71|nr:piggyBac transposable element-derived protein 4-like [Aphis gossypii]